MEKQKKSIIYSECVFVTLVIQHAKRTRLVVPSHVACLSIQSFSTLPRKSNDFRKKNYNNNIYLLQLGCHPVAVVILHVNKTRNWLLLNLSREGYMRSM